jgi:hypothetical protein
LIIHWRMSFFASSMKNVPKRSPTPRDPECNRKPDVLALIKAHLDKVVPGAERAQVIDALHMVQLGILIDGATVGSVIPSRGAILPAA